MFTNLSSGARLLGYLGRNVGPTTYYLYDFGKLLCASVSSSIKWSNGSIIELALELDELNVKQLE